jgi:hypothetical protein
MPRMMSNVRLILQFCLQVIRRSSSVFDSDIGVDGNVTMLVEDEYITGLD